MNIQEQILKFISRKLGVAGLAVLGILYLIPTPEYAPEVPGLIVYAVIVGLKILSCTGIAIMYISAQGKVDTVSRVKTTR